MTGSTKFGAALLPAKNPDCAALCVDPDKLGEALEPMKMAKLAAMGRRRRRKADGLSGEPTRPIAELCVADVDLRRAPRAAIDDFLANRAPPREKEKPRRRGRGRKRDRFASEEYHRWMLEEVKS